MKLAFSTENISCPSFLELCDTAAEYGFSGIEIFDAGAEIAAHRDSLLDPASTADSRRKLVNRHLEAAALTYPDPICSATAPEPIADCVELAANAGIQNVIIRFGAELPDGLESILTPAVKRAEEYGVAILLETCGALAHTERALEVINRFATAALGTAWNIRETFFGGGETARRDDTNPRRIYQLCPHRRPQGRHGCHNRRRRCCLSGIL